MSVLSKASVCLMVRGKVSDISRETVRDLGCGHVDRNVVVPIAWSP